MIKKLKNALLILKDHKNNLEDEIEDLTHERYEYDNEKRQK